ncbi:hypothetical protein BRYFOR_05799 [Marvinbryantia formatexigens DSM 14469]|uniref:Uncharacterized protein n=1 Tax=Marvinbryantia formatexigens DSM 14469 TaxID=478749 RepID=C6LB04_9FIRM|nr:hypothetical protein [Marvinbryantia formatexigens]EET62135.1 hypothetical protein BRYFOR_05799 [Marvinbryantia formatexigens DSM 14469]UWO26516.1 hypothetical protein NQ534_08695 [Marvinbryantia formatexigens DSM 14469]SDF77720.1 hypothetical protein SAMN05660368_01282 [Marvinbryantia formatexigens]
MNPEKIENTEMLYRAVRISDPDGFISGKPTAALFMDEKGVSVDRDGERTEQEIVETFRKRFGRRNDYHTAVKIGAGTCRSVETCPYPVGNKKNIYHAEIWESEDERRVSLFKAIRLAQLCKEV